MVPSVPRLRSWSGWFEATNLWFQTTAPRMLGGKLGARHMHHAGLARVAGVPDQPVLEDPVPRDRLLPPEVRRNRRAQLRREHFRHRHAIPPEHDAFAQDGRGPGLAEGVPVVRLDEAGVLQPPDLAVVLGLRVGVLVPLNPVRVPLDPPQAEGPEDRDVVVAL